MLRKQLPNGLLNASRKRNAPTGIAESAFGWSVMDNR